MADNKNNENGWLQTASDIGRGAVEGITFGQGVKVAAGVKSFVKGSSYDEELEKENLANKQAEERNPLAYNAAAIGASALIPVPGTAGVMAAARGAGMAAKVLPKVASGGKIAEKAGGIAKGMFDTLKSAKGNIQEKILSKTEGLAEKASGTFKSGFESLKSKGSELAESVGGKVAEAKDIFSSNLSKGIEAVSEKSAAAMKSTKEFAGNIASKLKPAGEKALEIGSNLAKKGGAFAGKVGRGIRNLGSKIGRSLFGKGDDEEEEDDSEEQSAVGEASPVDSNTPPELEGDTPEAVSGGDEGSLSEGKSSGGGLEGATASEILNKIYEELTKLNATSERMAGDISKMAKAATSKDTSADLEAANKQARASEEKGGLFSRFFGGGEESKKSDKKDSKNKKWSALKGIAAGMVGASFGLGGKEGDQSVVDMAGDFIKGTDTYKEYGEPAIEGAKSLAKSAWTKSSDAVGGALSNLFGNKKTGDLAEGEKLHKQIFPGISKAEERDMMMGGVDKKGKYSPFAMDKYLQATALIESGGNANAKAGTSSASGMFQFTKGTWQQMTKEMGKDYSLEDRFDPKKSAEVMQHFTEKNKKQFEKGTGKEATSTDMYMAHFLGAGGAVKFANAMAKDENVSAASIDPKAAEANRSIFYDKEGKSRSAKEVYELMNKKVSSAEQAVETGKWGKKAIPDSVLALSNSKGSDEMGAAQSLVDKEQEKYNKLKKDAVGKDGKIDADKWDLVAEQEKNLDNARYRVMDLKEKGKASPILEGSGSGEDLKLAAMGASTPVKEKPASENTSMMQSMMNGISQLAQNAMGGGQQQAPQQVAQAPKASAGTGGSMMAVRNDDPVLLTLTYGNVKTA